jgi:hypothetical protein
VDDDALARWQLATQWVEAQLVKVNVIRATMAPGKWDATIRHRFDHDHDTFTHGEEPRVTQDADH